MGALLSNIVLAATVTLTAGVGPVELPEYAPAGDAALTIDLELDGYVNGRMDPDRLMKVGKCLLERDAAYTYSLMREAAEQDGVRLVPGSCYRSFEIQDDAYNRRCPITNVPIYQGDGPDETQVGTKRVRICTGLPTAPAGHSNHGWGRAIDFTDNGRHLMSCYDSEFHWLKRNAHRFGWVHPAWAHCGMPQQEPWHGEFAGVTDPTLVDFVSIDPHLIATAE